MEPGRAVERGPDRTLAHLVVTDIAPAVQGGRYAVKRLVGDQLRIGADIFTDGHDVLAARALYRAPGDRHPASAPMTYSFEDDRWYADLPLDRVGEWWFTVEGWVDRFGTWRSELEKKVEAGQDVASELLEGAGLIVRHRQAQWRRCEFKREPLVAANEWINRYIACWEGRIDALAHLVETQQTDSKKDKS